MLRLLWRAAFAGAALFGLAVAVGGASCSIDLFFLALGLLSVAAKDWALNWWRRRVEVGRVS
jgi:hypothetical protein